MSEVAGLFSLDERRLREKKGGENSPLRSIYYGSGKLPKLSQKILLAARR